MEKGWGENDRGVSFVFGADVVSNFLEAQDLDLLVRAHQVVEDGYEFFAGTLSVRPSPACRPLVVQQPDSVPVRSRNREATGNSVFGSQLLWRIRQRRGYDFCG